MAKRMYIGAETDVPVYGEQIIDITGNNIEEYFSMAHNNTTYGFKWNTSQNAFISGNSGYNSSTGQTTFTALKDIPNLSFDYSWGSEGSCDRFYLTVAGTTVQNGVSGALTTKSWSGNLTKGQAIILKYTKDGSVHSNGDQCKMYNMKAPGIVQTGTVRKEAARKVVRAYISVAGIARKVKKIYRGVAGIARGIFVGGGLDYHGTITSMSTPTSTGASASIGNYGIFAGGFAGSTPTNIVEAYNSSLVKSTPSVLSQARTHFGGAHVGSYALFAGGSYGSNSTASQTKYSTVDTYNTSLSKSTATALSTAKRVDMGASTGTYAIFAGGSNGANDSRYVSYYATVNAYNSSLSRSDPTALSQGRDSMAVTTVGEYAIFAGGQYLGYAEWFGANTFLWSGVVDAYNSSLTRSVPTALATTRHNAAGASTGGYAIIAGGNGGGQIVETYNTSLTRSTAPDLSGTSDRTSIRGEVLDKYAMFVGGSCSLVDIYTDKLTKLIGKDVSITPNKSVPVGNYALFGDSNGTMEAYVYIPE